MAKSNDDVLPPKKSAHLSVSPPSRATDGDECTPVDLTGDPIANPCGIYKNIIDTRKKNLQAIIANTVSKGEYRLVSMVAVSVRSCMLRYL